jgi:DNA-binding NarL/FixJ family response regulator
LVEDDAGTRESLEALLRTHPAIELAGVYVTGEAALEGVPGQGPDVLLMDIRLPGIGGIEAVARLCRKMPDLSVLMLTTYEDANLIFESLRAGARGYLLKNRPFEELIEAIQQVREGGAPMSMRVARKVVAYFNEARPPQPGLEGLSAREQQVLSALASGKYYKEIAADMGVTENTVRTYVRRIYEKLHVSSKSEAVALFASNQPRRQAERPVRVDIPGPTNRS